VVGTVSEGVRGSVILLFLRSAHQDRLGVQTEAEVYLLEMSITGENVLNTKVPQYHHAGEIDKRDVRHLFYTKERKRFLTPLFFRAARSPEVRGQAFRLTSSKKPAKKTCPSRFWIKFVEKKKPRRQGNAGACFASRLAAKLAQATLRRLR